MLMFLDVHLFYLFFIIFNYIMFIINHSMEPLSFSIQPLYQFNLLHISPNYSIVIKLNLIF